jgi:hypothetical protein
MEGFVQSLIVMALLVLAELAIRELWQKLHPLSLLG